MFDGARPFEKPHQYGTRALCGYVHMYECIIRYTESAQHWSGADTKVHAFRGAPIVYVYLPLAAT